MPTATFFAERTFCQRLSYPSLFFMWRLYVYASYIIWQKLLSILVHVPLYGRNYLLLSYGFRTPQLLSSLFEGECSCKLKYFMFVDITDNRKNRKTALRNLADQRAFLKRLLSSFIDVTGKGNSEDEIGTVAGVRETSQNILFTKELENKQKIKTIVTIFLS